MHDLKRVSETWKALIKVFDDRKNRDLSSAVYARKESLVLIVAIVLGSYLSDPISEHIGRRGALFIAAIFSFAAVFGASRAQSWQELLVTRIVLGLGVGGKVRLT